jgi:hypothetical protein
MKKLIITTIAMALVCSAGMFSSCSKSDEENKTTEEGGYDPAVNGIVGEWYSAGTDVASLLQAYNDSIYAKFNDNGTYLVEQYKGNVKTTDLVGVYAQAKSTVGNIWTYFRLSGYL